MRIVLLGAPGSGKGTQAVLLVKELGLPHISTGELLRNAAETGTRLGLKARAVIDRGDLVADDIMLGLITERLSRDDAQNGFILDGYPRNISQAKALDEILDRREQPMVEVVHIDTNAEPTTPLIEYYAGKGVLSRVLGQGSAEEVFQRIMSVLLMHSES